VISTYTQYDVVCVVWSKFYRPMPNQFLNETSSIFHARHKYSDTSIVEKKRKKVPAGGEGVMFEFRLRSWQMYGISINLWTSYDK
jgi:hypothetical protein